MKNMIKKTVSVFVLVILSIFLYVLFGRKELKLSKAYIKEKYSSPNSHFVKWKGSELHYTESGSGFPIVMIHGFGGGGYDFELLDSLLNHKYKIIRIDLPGFGLSDFPEEYKNDDDFLKIYETFYTFLLDTLRIDSLYVVGNSLGGIMACDLTIHHPDKVKKLILLNSAGYDMAETLKTAHTEIFRLGVVKLALKRGMPYFLTKSGIDQLFYNPANLSEKKSTIQNDMWNREGNLSQVLAMANSDKFLDQHLIKTISCPTLIIWGKNDQIILPKNAERFHKDIKNSTLIMYDSCGHMPMIEKPFQVQRDVLEFLSR